MLTVISSLDKHLKNVALALDSHRKNFILKTVTNEFNCRGINNGQEWQSTDHELECNSSLKFEATYEVEVTFSTQEFGTFRQHVLFGFGNEHPVMLRKICVDCVPEDDLNRLEDASLYVLNLNQRLLNQAHHECVPFSSPFVPAKDPREEYLAKVYPYPDTNNFILTHDTLTEDSLTPTNYKGRLHELVTVEELARHEQVARYNEAAKLRLSSCYILNSDTDGSSLAKYAPPGELFAQV